MQIGHLHREQIVFSRMNSRAQPETTCAKDASPTMRTMYVLGLNALTFILNEIVQESQHPYYKMESNKVSHLIHLIPVSSLKGITLA